MTVHFAGPTQVKQHLALAARAAVYYEALHPSRDFDTDLYKQQVEVLRNQALVKMETHLQAALMDESSPEFLNNPAAYLTDQVTLQHRGQPVSVAPIDYFKPASGAHVFEKLDFSPNTGRDTWNTWTVQPITKHILEKAASSFISTLAKMSSSPAYASTATVPHLTDQSALGVQGTLSALDLVEREQGSVLKSPAPDVPTLRQYITAVFQPPTDKS